MYFPWVGLLEQIRLANVFVHYDDVQFSRGFFNRVQIKTPSGIKWLTVPLKGQSQNKKIDEICIDFSSDWQNLHRNILKQSYSRAPFLNDMLRLVDTVFSKKLITLADISRESIIELSKYFGLSNKLLFVNSSDLNISGSSSQRLHDICVNFNANVYITGLGALNYLDYSIFERSSIDVQYMNYKMLSYPQLHGPFTPYVSSLDLVANLGIEGAKYICSESITYKQLI